MKETVSIDEAIDLLNSALFCDPQAITFLVQSRRNCSRELGEHPAIQVEKRGPNFRVGPLGLINGLFGVDGRGWGPIVAVFGDDGKILRFERTPELATRTGA